MFVTVGVLARRKKKFGALIHYREWPVVECGQGGFVTLEGDSHESVSLPFATLARREGKKKKGMENSNYI